MKNCGRPAKSGALLSAKSRNRPGSRPFICESIENDDYRILPGGIFNKGFVKSYAKFVGINEQEALSDYAELTGRNTAVDEDDLKVYRPEVLTDDRADRR